LSAKIDDISFVTPWYSLAAQKEERGRRETREWGIQPARLKSDFLNCMRPFRESLIKKSQCQQIISQPKVLSSFENTFISFVKENEGSKCFL
jgi:hypothetical protein